MIEKFSGDYRFLSNFYPCYIDGVKTTVEHLYQAAKTDDPDQKRAILTAKRPSIAKFFGRTCNMIPNWDGKKLFVMDDLVTKKFTQNAELKQQLIATHPHELVEGNNWGDTYWGVCNGVGSNILGQLLMDIREELMQNN